MKKLVYPARPTLAAWGAYLLLLVALPGAAQSLFQKYTGNPVFNTGGNVPAWRSVEVANVAILNPAQTSDGKWRLWVRGTGNGRSQIGTFDQSASSFNPYGPWAEYSGNPVIRNGPSGYDDTHALDVVAASGPNKEVYLYYMGRNGSSQSSLNGAVSTNGGFSFTKFSNNPLKYDVGPNDAVYTGGQYHLYYGDAKWNGSGFNEPLQIWHSQSGSPTALANQGYALRVGPAGAFDSFSVNGARIFRVGGDNRWFMLYQASSRNFDYPERLHCAYSSDLVNWTKVNNGVPLLQRGNAGAWDQGAIWTGAVFEHSGRLYVYYEGYGSYGSANRDQVYYPGGNSRVGAASCAVGDFLSWVGGGSGLANNSAYEIINQHSLKTLEISGGSVLDEARVTQWDYFGGANQKFQLQDVGGGYYRLTPTHATSKCLEVYGWSQTNEARVVQWEYFGNPNQQWSLTNRGNGYYSIVNRHSGKALEVYGWDRGNDARIVQWDYLGNPNQLWALAPIRAGQRSAGLAAAPGAAAGPVVRVFPNPAAHQVAIDLGEVAAQATVEVRASTGQLLLRKEVERSAQLTLDLASVRPGVLWLRITTDQKTETQKLVLNR